MGAPELHRSGHTGVDPDHAAEVAEPRPLDPGLGDNGGPVPPGNRRGARPARDQDKPTGPPPRTRRSRQRSKKGGERFDFRFDGPFRLVDRAFFVDPDRAYVAIEGDELRIRFGPWHLRTPVANVAGAEVTGPYALWKVIGPPRVSLKDRGITFATTTAAGACIRFEEPVPAAAPTSIVRHPAATVTVADPEALARALQDIKDRAA